MPGSDSQQFSDRTRALPLKSHLFNRGITTKDFATRIGCSREHLLRVLNRRVPLSKELAVVIAFELGLSNDVLVLLGPPWTWGARGHVGDRRTVSLPLRGRDLAGARRLLKEDAAAATAATVRLTEAVHTWEPDPDECLDAAVDALVAFWQFVWSRAGFRAVAPEADGTRVLYSPPEPDRIRAAAAAEKTA